MFKFRLQRVLELREEHERAKAIVLAGAKDAADAARRAQGVLETIRDHSRKELHAANTNAPRIGHLHQLGFVVESIDERVKTAMESVRVADESVATAQSALTEAARDRQILDRLKSRHEEEFRSTEAHADRLQMDEIALARFGRSTNPRSDSTTS